MRLRLLFACTFISTSLMLLDSCSTDNTIADNPNTGSDGSDTEVIDDAEPLDSIDDVLSGNGETHDSTDDYEWDTSSVIDIILNGTSISSDGAGVNIDQSIATITSAATYRITGTLTDGRIIVDTDDDDATVKLILDNAAITSNTNSPLSIMGAEKAVIIVPEGTDNYLTDAASYVFDGDDDEPDATLFSKDDLTIYGNGSLTIDGNYNEAIKSKDGLILKEANITITSVDDGIQGKDYLVIQDGNYNITVAGDGLKSSNDEDADLGYILIESGDFDITSSADGIQAETDLIISGGTFNIKSGGGSSTSLSGDASAKGLKANTIITIDQNPVLNINSADDAIHSNNEIQINGGTITIATGDDGIHADTTLEINGGTLEISNSIEGLEATFININNGTITIAATDDGINATMGTEVMNDDGSKLNVNGGLITVNMSGNDVDAMDSNGDIVILGGVVHLNFPSQRPSSGLDANGTVTIGDDATVYLNGVEYQ